MEIGKGGSLLYLVGKNSDFVLEGVRVLQRCRNEMFDGNECKNKGDEGASSQRVQPGDPNLVLRPLEQ